nr:hypothetical protein [Tanacetum cinerariifolium]
MNKKNYSFDLETFRDMLQICPSLLDQNFVDSSFEEEILTFIRKLGYPGNVKSLPDESDSYKTYHDLSTGKAILKPKSQAHDSGAHEGTGIIPGVLDVPTYGSDDEQISWKSSDDEDDDTQDDDNVYDQDDDVQDDDNEQTESDDDGDDFVHPKLSTFDEEERQDEEDKEAVGIDSIVNLNTESTSLIDVPVTTNDEIPPLSITTLPPPPIPLIHPLQQTPIFTPTIAPITSQQNLLTFGSLFKFEDRVKDLEDNSLKFKKTNLFVEIVSSIPSIVDTYLANKMNEAVKIAVQLQLNRLRDEAQAENRDPINKLDENIKNIIKEQVKVQVKEQVSKILPRIEKLVNKQLKAEVLNHLSHEAKTSHVVAANLFELELKKILIDKMESNKLIYRSDQQKTLYKALIDAYETDKVILETYRDIVTFKQRRDDEDEYEEPFAGSNRRSKRRRARKEPELKSAPKEKTSKSTGSSKEGSKSKTRSTDKSAQAEEEVHTGKDLEELAHQEFETARPPTPDRDWNKTFPAIHGLIQPWISTLAQKEDPRESFNKLIDTSLDFLVFVLNQLNVDTLTLALLAGLTFELVKGSCKSLTKAADYGHIKWIEDLVTSTIWSLVLIVYDKHALWGISYWGQKRQQFYGYAINKESVRDVYSRNRIIAIKKLTIVEWHNYKHLEWITVRRDDDKLYTFKEGDYNRLRLQDIEDMMILLV